MRRLATFARLRCLGFRFGFLDTSDCRGIAHSSCAAPVTQACASWNFHLQHASLGAIRGRFFRGLSPTNTTQFDTAFVHRVELGRVAGYA